jgi:hypothetical protein
MLLDGTPISPFRESNPVGIFGVGKTKPVLGPAEPVASPYTGLTVVCLLG